MSPDRPGSQSPGPDQTHGPGRGENDRGRAQPGPGHQDEALAQIVKERQEREFGGMKFGAAFFGWLTAVGTTVLLVAVIVGAGGVVGFATDTDPGQVVGQVSDQAQEAGLISGIVLLVVLLVSYFAGGYVAGRMARFSGAKQGVAVWLWSVIIAIVLAVIGAVAGSRFDVLSQLDGLPQIPISGDDLTTGAIVAAALVILVTLGGAVLGGLAGMRYHRRVDKSLRDLH